ncbi:hypothetical protein ACP275_08G094500 [Erythranthe tilingii]
MAATNCLHLPAIGNFTHPTRSFAAVTRSSLTDQSQSPSSVAAKRHLLRLVSDQDRGIKTQSDPQKLSQIVEAIDSLAAVGRGTVTTDRSLSATWRLLWTTEKEQLFIVKNASFFGSMSSRVRLFLLLSISFVRSIVRQFCSIVHRFCSIVRRFCSIVH